MKWFWIGLFAFLSFLVVSANITRPDTVDATLAYTGNYLAVIGWSVVAVFVIIPVGLIVGGLIAAWVVISRRINANRRPVDGSHALVKVNPKKPAVWYDPNQQVGSATAWHPQIGWKEFDGGTGWDIQSQIAGLRARVAAVQAAVPGDQTYINAKMAPARTNGWRDAKVADRVPKAWELAPTHAQLTGPVMATAPVQPLTLASAVRASERERIVFGYSPTTGEHAVWDVTETPHMRLHGGTQKGKTSAGITIVAGVLARLWRVVVLDPRQFKNWQIAGDYADLQDVSRPDAFVRSLEVIHAEYQRRDLLLGQHQAKDIMALPAGIRPPRMAVVVEEYGAQRFRAQGAGTLQEVDNLMSILTSEAAADGIHVIAIDQRPTNYHPMVKANLGNGVVFNLPDGAGRAAGYARAHKLPQYQFWYDGDVYQSVDAAPTFADVVRSASPVRYPPLIDVVRSVVREDAENTQLPRVPNDRTAPPNADFAERPNALEPETDPGPTDLQAAVWAWRDAHEDGSQADMRHDFEAMGIDIARGYAHELWHKWPGVQADSELIDLAQLRASGLSVSFIGGDGKPYDYDARGERKPNK